MKNRFFNKNEKQTRIEKKIERYYKAFKDDSIRETLDKLPKTQTTLDLIESELETVVDGMNGESSREKWFNFTKGLDAVINTDFTKLNKEKEIKE